MLVKETFLNATENHDRYEDSEETYLREVWVTLYDEYRAETVVTKTYHALA